MIKNIVAMVVVFLCMTSIVWAFDYEVGDIYYSDGEKYQIISISSDKIQIIVEPYKEPPSLPLPPEPNYQQEYYKQLLIEKGWME